MSRPKELEQTTRVALDGEIVTLNGDELGLLLQALAEVELRAGESVADQIAALRLAGGLIDLMPTEAELAALGLALGTLHDAGGSELARLAAICNDGGPGPEPEIGTAWA